MLFALLYKIARESGCQHEPTYCSYCSVNLRHSRERWLRLACCALHVVPCGRRMAGAVPPPSQGPRSATTPISVGPARSVVEKGYLLSMVALGGSRLMGRPVTRQPQAAEAAAAQHPQQRSKRASSARTGHIKIRRSHRQCARQLNREERRSHRTNAGPRVRGALVRGAPPRSGMHSASDSRLPKRTPGSAAFKTLAARPLCAGAAADGRVGGSGGRRCGSRSGLGRRCGPWRRCRRTAAGHHQPRCSHRQLAGAHCPSARRAAAMAAAGIWSHHSAAERRCRRRWHAGSTDGRCSAGGGRPCGRQMAAPGRKHSARPAGQAAGGAGRRR